MTFLDLSAENPEWIFADWVGHLSPKGMLTVSSTLADAIVEHARREH